MKTEKIPEEEKLFVTFKNLLQTLVFFKISTQKFEAGDFLTILLRF